MKELPGDVFVSPQILPEQFQALAEQGVKSIINNRPDMEVPASLSSDEMSNAAQAAKLNYSFIPMAGGLSAELIEATVQAYENMPRPIFAYCASGTRTTALWCFAHVEALGVDDVLDAAANAGYNLSQIRGGLTQYLEGRR